MFGCSWIGKLLVIMSFSFDFSAQALDKKDNVQGSHKYITTTHCVSLCTFFDAYYGKNLLLTRQHQMFSILLYTCLLCSSHAFLSFMLK